ncbi:SprT-like family protein [Leptospira inadai serovar Lyme str. 10]|uniref:SprT-like family protein n=2 Tax=Leptospira inadai serovar Lyme TaxID=293084 RepID=V6HW28_9LEPT|nr:SprT-like domain-containing protein [Leptospira inadai]EQA37114.1 SprT-like family protein [Leptospira inadai serovar Lyme str. 10]PNV76646.1 SprT-like family protein [Leptospira inadai serovar Lyme]
MILPEDWESLLFETWTIISQSSRRPNPPLKRIELKFYPYRNGTSSLQFKNGILTCKLHDSFKNVDLVTAESLAKLLISRLLRQTVEAGWKTVVQEHLNKIPRLAAPVKTYPAKGNHYDLNRVFAYITKKFFPAQNLSDVRIEWSPRKGERRIGTYDKETLTIRISPTLDHPDIPEFVLEHVVHHEILHHLFPVQRNKNRNIIHGWEFKRKEREYDRYEEAAHWLKTSYHSFLAKNGRGSSPKKGKPQRKRFLFSFR